MFDEGAWDAYHEANRLFAQTIANEAREGDLIWVHDYHLMILPQMLREEFFATRKEEHPDWFLFTYAFS